MDSVRRAYSYKRFSSTKQARGDSLRRQTEFEQEVIKDMGLTLDDSLDLTDRGISGFRGDNSKFGALSRFLQAVETGTVPAGSFLLVENLDRLSRENVLDAFTLFNRIISAGITLVTATPRDVYSRETVQNDVSKLMVPIVYMMRAHDESAQKSTRLHKAWSRRREKALNEGKPLTGRCPAWLKVVDGKYEVIEEYAETIRLIYQWVGEGLGIHRVTMRLAAEKRLAFGRTGEWTDVYVRKLLQWPAVYGVLQPQVLMNGVQTPHGPPVPDYYPAIISKEEFDIAQATRAGRKRKTGRPAAAGKDENLFTGIVYLANDKSRMCLVSSGQNAAGERYQYLSSGEAFRGRKSDKSKGRSVPYPMFERMILASIDSLRVSDFIEQEKGGSETSDAIDKMMGSLAAIDQKIEELQNEYCDPDIEITAEDFFSAWGKLESKKKEMSETLSVLQSLACSGASETPNDARDLIELLDLMKLGPERSRFRGRLKTKLRWLVTEIWVLVEPKNHNHSIFHTQIFLRNGEILNRFTATREDLKPTRLYRNVDLRSYSS